MTPDITTCSATLHGLLTDILADSSDSDLVERAATDALETLEALNACVLGEPDGAAPAE